MTNNNYIQFEFETYGNEQVELLIDLLADQGFEGFEENENILSGFIKENEFNVEEFAGIATLFEHFSYTSSIVENINWNQQWESSFSPVIVNDFAAIRASFHQPVAYVKHDMIITPRMSFGTGHHATTYLVIEQMSTLDLINKTGLDFGTGTGVLAILAEKMGASSVKAIDNDEWSIENLKENIAANGCKKIIIQQADSIPVDQHFDVILANINLHVILASLPAIAEVSKTGTIVLLSGFLYHDITTLYSAIKENNFSINGPTKKGEWVCFRISKH